MRRYRPVFESQQEHCLGSRQWQNMETPMIDKVDGKYLETISGNAPIYNWTPALIANDGTQRRRDENAPHSTETQSRRSLE